VHPRIAELLDYVEAQTAALRAAYDDVPAEQRGRRPAPGRWSPAEIVHHLAIVERRIAGRVTILVEQARALPPEEEDAPLRPELMMSRVANRTARFLTSESSEPRDTDTARVWDDLTEARRALRDAALSGGGLALGRVSAPHPVLGDFSAYEWIAFAGAHAARHAAQMREITSMA
jgi:hypothetical protein